MTAPRAHGRAAGNGKPGGKASETQEPAGRQDPSSKPRQGAGAQPGPPFDSSFPAQVAEAVLRDAFAGEPDALPPSLLQVVRDDLAMAAGATESTLPVPDEAAVNYVASHPPTRDAVLGLRPAVLDFVIAAEKLHGKTVGRSITEPGPWEALELALHLERQVALGPDADGKFPPWEGPEVERQRLAAAGVPPLEPVELPEAATRPGAVLPAPQAPMPVARAFAGLFTEQNLLALRNWRGGWWQWQRSHWTEREAAAVREAAYRFTEDAVFLGPKGQAPWAPNRNKIANLLEALEAVAYLDARTSQPAWLDGRAAGTTVATANGLLDLHRRVLLPHSPLFFNVTAVPFEYDPSAPAPAVWLDFLSRLWPNDPDSIAALQEFFGYVVSGRLDYHKILLIVGPTRGGKGTIARTLGQLVGSDNVAGPTLSSLSFDFGLAPLLGKSLAVISDARLDAQRDASVVVERLLSISGEDTITVNRKFKDQWTGKLPTRFVIVSNELPRLGDASGTIANRFVALQLERTWLGREDRTLEGRIWAELPGILNWSLAGLDRLAAQGRFTRPASTDEAIIALMDLASPVAAFVRELCDRGHGYEVAIQGLFAAWSAWATANGNRPGNAQTFGRNLRAVVPYLRVSQPRDGESRDRVYRGVRLSPPHNDEARVPLRANGQQDPSGTQWHAGQSIVGVTRTQADPEGELPVEQDYPRSAWDLSEDGAS